CYGEAAAAVADGSFCEEKVTYWMQRLSSVFNRGFWNGYYLGQKLGEWSTTYGSAATKRRIYLGKVTNYFKKLNVAEIKLETGSLNINDVILITGPTTGVIEHTVNELRDQETLPVASAAKGSLCTVPLDSLVRRADKVYRWVDASEIRKK
ncbi:MAG: U32 family peptidase, partial [Bacteroidales bacterium]|nr:U32 family peptidase [Bacteroidales bacterium]